MAWGEMRIGEVLKLIPNEIKVRKVLLRTPKRGKDWEINFIP
jgi:hypothetical protein